MYVTAVQSRLMQIWVQPLTMKYSSINCCSYGGLGDYVLNLRALHCKTSSFWFVTDFSKPNYPHFHARPFNGSYLPFKRRVACRARRYHLNMQWFVPTSRSGDQPQTSFPLSSNKFYSLTYIIINGALHVVTQQ